VIDAPLAFAFTAGLVAAVNPCGFPMLPAYLSFFIGTDDEAADGAGRVPRALASGLAVSAGFFLVFVGIGLPIDAGLDWIIDWVPWATMVIGVMLAVLGAAMIARRAPTITLPRLDRGGRTRGAASMVLFGVSYAIASLGCTLPIFLIAVARTAERENLASGVASFVAYAAGMSVVLLAVSVALALAREGMVRWLRSALAYVDRVAGLLLVAVGVYLVYYGIVAIRDDDVLSSPLAFVEDLSVEATTWLADGGTGLGLLMAAVVAVALAGSLLLRRARR
jgi:cytochrome c biogenesis protein CcdA